MYILKKVRDQQVQGGEGGKHKTENDPEVSSLYGQMNVVVLTFHSPTATSL